jgi:hypothetical protein
MVIKLPKIIHPNLDFWFEKNHLATLFASQPAGDQSQAFGCIIGLGKHCTVTGGRFYYFKRQTIASKLLHFWGENIGEKTK